MGYIYLFGIQIAKGHRQMRWQGCSFGSKDARETKTMTKYEPLWSPPKAATGTRLHSSLFGEQDVEQQVPNREVQALPATLSDFQSQTLMKCTHFLGLIGTRLWATQNEFSGLQGTATRLNFNKYLSLLYIKQNAAFDSHEYRGR